MGRAWTRRASGLLVPQQEPLWPPRRPGIRPVLSGLNPRRGHHRHPSIGILASAQQLTAAGVPLEAAVGSFLAPNSATTGTTVTVSGLTFQPKIVLLWMNGRLDADTTQLGTAVGGRPVVGVFSGTGNRLSISGTMETGVGTTATAGMWRDDSALIHCGTNSANNYRTLDVDSINSDGFTLSIDSLGNVALSWFGLRVWYLALGGDAITNVFIDDNSTSAGTGNQAVSGLGFGPGGMLFFTYNNSKNTFTDAGVGLGLGAATAAAEQWAWWGASRDGTATVDAAGELRSGECEGLISRTGAGITARESLVSLDSDGWTLNRHADFAHGYGYAAIKGPRMKAGTFSCSSGGGSVSLGWRPRAVIFMTNAKASLSGGSAQDDFTFAIGAVAGSTQRSALVFENDTDDPSAVATGHRNDGVIMTVDSSKALDSRIAATLGSTGFSYTMPLSTLSGYPVGYMAFGDAPA